MEKTRVGLAMSWACLWLWGTPVKAASSAEGAAAATRDVRTEVEGILAKHCADACVIMDVRVEVDEDGSDDLDDLGFEGLSNTPAPSSMSLKKVAINVQVDDRVSALNRDRLQVLLINGLQKYAAPVEVIWRPITLPQIGQSGAKEQEIRRRIEEQLTAAITRVMETYCPEECVLSAISIDGKLVTPDEAQALPPEQVVRDRSGEGIFKVEGIDIDVSVDAALPVDTRLRIASLMRAKTLFVAPVDVQVSAVPFPESYVKKREREIAEAKEREKEKERALEEERTKALATSRDPYGLGKLRETLKIFRELAGTKEIITTQKDTRETSSTDKSTQSSKEISASSKQEATDPNIRDQMANWPVERWAMVAGGLILLLGLVVFIIMRFAAASRDARLMVEAASPMRSMGPGARTSDGPMEGAPQASVEGRGLTAEERRELGLRARNVELREELIKVFFDAPRVAKATFSRILQEEGVEETARYVHIFGHLVIFELLGDPNLQRDLNDLSEFYHNSEFAFTAEEENRLLLALKTRVTANEIRVMARRQMDQFDFLTKLDPNQIFNLIIDEKPQLQSIVLTQLDHKRRRAVFDLYTGQRKLDLMAELSRAEALPKEFLSNVAKALAKKVSGRPEFDTQNLRTSEILLEFMEKSPLEEQKSLLGSLVESNPEGARAIKLRLVTIEILPYLRDGHLLEIIMGLERSDLVTFLAGTREHIRHLILSKAPEELSESWIEELSGVRHIEEQTYRLVEMKVLNRIRYLASEGFINLMEINEMIFASSPSDDAAAEDYGDGGRIVSQGMVS